MINVINLLDILHSNILHQGTKKLKDKIEELKIYYYGNSEDIEQFKHLCPISIQQNIRLKKESFASKLLWINLLKDL